jgi:hypothetical protein
MVPEPTPEHPREVGVHETVPAELGQIEGARILGNDARERLRADGFTDQQIDEWAETYVAEVGGGTVDEFVSWIAALEQHGTRGS